MELKFLRLMHGSSGVKALLNTLGMSGVLNGRCRFEEIGIVWHNAIRGAVFLCVMARWDR